MRTHLPKIGGILLMLLIIGSCKKDYQNGEIPEQEPNNKLQQWYNANLKVADQNTFSNLKPVWKTTYAAQVGEQIVYEVEFASPEKFIVKSADNVRSISGGVENLDMEVHRHNVKLLLFEDALTGDIRNAAYMAIESNVSANFGSLHYKDLGNFTGKVYFHHFNGKLSNGWVYQNGKIISQLSNITKAQYDYEQKFAAQGKQTNAITCYTSYADNYMYVCVYINGYYNDCRWQYAGSSYYSACSFTEPSSIGDVNGSGGGYTDQPLKPDCAGVLGGTAYIDLNCNECIGGTTGKTECPPIDTATKDVKNPCIKEALLLALGKNVQSKIKSLMVGTFMQNKDINLHFESLRFNPNGANAAADAYTSPWNNNNKLSQVISFNETILPVKSKEYMVATVYHEVLHAYLSNLFPTDQEGKILIPNDHEYMVNNYITLISNDLKIQFPSMSETEAWALAWGGLERTSRYALLSPATKRTIAEINLQYSTKPGTNTNIKSKGSYCP